MFSDELTMSLISISIQNTVDSKIRERAVVDYFDLVGLFQNTIGTRALPATLRVFLEHFWTLYGRDPGLFSSADFEGRLGIPGGENV
jgi:hypothetical protein